MNRAMLCEEYQEAFMEALGRGADTKLSRDASAHRASCSECAAASLELEAGWEAFEQLPRVEPPRTLRERTRGSVLVLMAEERAVSARRGWLDAVHVPLAVASGLLVAAATLSLLGGLVGGSRLPQGHLFFCAAILAGLLVGAFSWIYSATTVHGVHLDAAARVGLLALAITVAATTTCPELHVLKWWEGSSVGLRFTELLGAGASSLVFGFVYGLFPGFLAALFGGKLLSERPIANGLVAVGVVFLLATPVIYLQSAPFTSGVIASWLAGTAAGTLCGVFGALRVRRRVVVVAA